MKRTSAPAKRLRRWRWRKSSPPQAHSVTRCRAPGASQAASRRSTFGWPRRSSSAARSARACSRFLGVDSEAVATLLSAYLAGPPSGPVTRCTRPKEPWPRIAAAFRPARHASAARAGPSSSVTASSATASLATQRPQRACFFCLPKRSGSEWFRRWPFWSSRGVSGVPGGGVCSGVRVTVVGEGEGLRRSPERPPHRLVTIRGICIMKLAARGATAGESYWVRAAAA
mmetsp:Transcript_8127/g.24298  ORF Transcript_8127/g.24298 Transcript_8127/m.24298 type:complete len:228 (-) Transcript_8127:221-904(-)